MGEPENRRTGACLVLIAVLLVLAVPVRAGDPPAPRFALVGSRPAPPAAVRPQPSNNPHGDIAIACEACHTAETWTTLREPLLFDHDRDTPFVLLGRHEQAACRSCHVDLRFDRPDVTPDDCASCHLDVHRGQLGDDCASCHTTQDFALVRGVEIHARTGFPLTGAHLAIACEACHEGDPDGAFAPLDPTCFACHAADYEATAGSAVSHPAAGFPTTCETCHNTLAFGVGTVFDHASVSGGFALVGAHARAECSACHSPGDLAPLFPAAGQDDCYACHAADYEATASTALVDHVAAGLPTTCLDCHNVETWAGATVDHAAVSGGFSLVGAHLAIACEACHRSPDFSVPENPAGQNDCAACHADDHEAAHPGFPTTCLDCHTTTAFLPATFDHVAVSGGFGLVGAHMALPCEACHVGPDFEPIFEAASQDDCVACHAEDHEREHPAFPTTCLDCHSVTSFEGAAFDHAATTGFPLVGAHLAIACESCHTGPDFEVIFNPSSADDCFACHADEHADEHPSFPTTCLDCHTTSSWEGAAFDHGSATGFPLVGAHLALDCSACHVGPDFEVIFDPASANDCFACHADDYQDEHAGSGFPTTCLDCHTTDTWEGATFDHDPLFPIYSGKHEGEWDSCQSCHVQPGNFQVFSCIDCHEHNREDTDDHHEDVGGYVYESNACFSCHPDGED